VSNDARADVRPALAIAGALLVARVWFIAHRALDLDEFEHAHAAWSVAQGLLPYRDFFEHHPPGLYFAIAPLFGAPAVMSFVDTAARSLIVARAAMWLTMVGSTALVYRLGVLLRGRVAGALAVALLATSSQFLDSMLEIRPDVPAVLCVLAAIWSVARAETRGGPVRPAAYLAGGAAFGLSLLFTQKTLFAAPGLAVALLQIDRRFTRAGLFAFGAIAPLAATAWWFYAHGALAPLWYNTVTISGRLNADGFSPVPRLVSSVVQQPAIYMLGLCAVAASARSLIRSSDRERAIVGPILYPAVSLLAGIFVIGRAYDQYYALLLPLLAVLGGAMASDLAARLPSVRARAATTALIVAAAAISYVNYVRTFAPMAPQIEEMAWVMQHTTPRDAYLGGSPGAALFRPHAWFYFFLTGAFAGDADYRALEAALESGAGRPRLVVMDRYFQGRAPASLLAYVTARFRRARGDLYLRQSEYGSSTLNASDASERFDRPLTR